MDFKICERIIGNKGPVFIIAELSANHLHNKDIAIKTIKAIKNSGADAVKLQTYTADTMTIDSDEDCFKIKQGTLWDGDTYYGLYERAHTPWEWHAELQKLTEDLGMVFFSSPFDRSAVDFLEELDVPAYKIASFEITDIPLIEYVASKNKPVIISTGIATRLDIEEAIDACRRMGNYQIALLKCTSAYPTPIDELNLRTIPDLKTKFNVVSGLSDHTLEIAVPIAAVAIGASIIEKHFILDRSLGGPDAEFSLEPEEFKIMVDNIRKTEKALGKIEYSPTKLMRKGRKFSRSLFVVEDMKAGEVFTDKNIRSIRPGDGLSPKYMKDVIGKTTKIDVKRGTPLSKKHINEIKSDFD